MLPFGLGQSTEACFESLLLEHAGRRARSVEIQCGADVLLEDNYFDMNGGTKAVKILRGQPDCVSVRSVYDIR